MTISLNKNFWLLLILSALLTAGFTITSELSWFMAAWLFLILLIIFFIKYPEIGIYLIAFLFPFNYFEFVYGSINVPYVDLIALILFIAWGINKVYLYFEKGQKINLKNWPAWFFMSVFVLVCLVSLINVEKSSLFFSIKYLLRPVIFFYLMYVILPFNIIDNLKKLFTTFKVMFTVGVGISLMGIWSLIFPPVEGLRRAIPISIFGVYPLGTNHNLLAEVFVSLIPIALILFWQEKDVLLKNIYLLGAFLMIGVNLLTLSRGGWLALGIELLILAALKYGREVKKVFASYITYIILFLLTPAFYLMYQLMTSAIVTSSSLARLKLIEISWILFQEHPFLGSGIGSFTNVLWQFNWYIIEYGGVTDAHGLAFKIIAETGAFGLLSFSALLAYILFVLFKGYNQSKQTQYSWLILGCLMAVIGSLTFQLFGTGYFLAKLWLPIGLALTTLKLTNTYFVKK
jgi:O-antigen ligase